MKAQLDAIQLALKELSTTEERVDAAVQSLKRLDDVIGELASTTALTKLHQQSQAWKKDLGRIDDEVTERRQAGQLGLIELTAILAGAPDGPGSSIGRASSPASAPPDAAAASIRPVTHRRGSVRASNTVSHPPAHATPKARPATRHVQLRTDGRPAGDVRARGRALRSEGSSGLATARIAADLSHSSRRVSGRDVVRVAVAAAALVGAAVLVGPGTVALVSAAAKNLGPPLINLAASLVALATKPVEGFATFVVEETLKTTVGDQGAKELRKAVKWGWQARQKSKSR